MNDQKNLNDIEAENTAEQKGAEAGWLEQFEALKTQSLKALEDVVAGGLNEQENNALIKFAADIIVLAQVHDSEALEKVTAQLGESSDEES